MNFNSATMGLLFVSLFTSSVYAEEPKYYQQILDRLKTDDTVIPWQPDGVQDIALMFNRETPIPPQCYTDSNAVHNPCYVCHQDAIPGRENTKNDRELQEAYSFSDQGLTNHWFNLFEDRSTRVNAISDQEILDYIDQDNYTELKQRLIDANFTGWIPDLKDLEKGAAAFDSEGFALDGSWWVAFNYKPLPSTFWPTNGSTDDVMIRLPAIFYKTTDGSFSLDVYKANLALVEANIKGKTSISALTFNEQIVGVDLNGDSQLTTAVSEINAQREHYVGMANNVDLIPFVYPQGTEFLHTVRYVGFDEAGDISISTRMKEVRYMVRELQSRHFQLEHWYIEENLEKEEGNLPTYINKGHNGLSSKFGWNVTGFLEDRNGRLRWNTFEENVFCMGCHTSIGSTVDKTFSFPRKVDGATGWGYINLKGMQDVPNNGETKTEIQTYLERVGGGTEFRSNPELEARFYHADGSINTVALASAKDVYDIITPSRQRALTLNKAYKAIVEEQDFIYGRDATVTPPQRVLSEVDNATSPTLPTDKQFDWDITLDWSKATVGACFFVGDIDFNQLTSAHTVSLSSDTDFDSTCTDGEITLSGDLQVTLNDGFTPQPGDVFEIISANNLNGSFDNVQLPAFSGGAFELIQTSNALSLLVVPSSTQVPIPGILLLSSMLAITGMLAGFLRKKA